MWNVASDDAHHYDDAAEIRARGEPAYPGALGWVMVRATREESALREALERGEFYSTTGPLLESLAATGDTLALTVAGDGAGVRVRFVTGPQREPVSVSGHTATLRYDSLSPGVRWVRAVVDDAAGHHAWTQPVRLERDGSRVHARGPFTGSPVAAAVHGTAQ